MAPKYHCFQNYSRLYNVPGIPSEEEENALTNAAFEAFQGARQIEIPPPSGTVVEIATFWRRTPHYENVMKEQREDFMRRIAGLPFRVILAGRSVMRDPYDVSGTPDRVCILAIQLEYRKP